MSKKYGWIGVDLDGTLATYDHWRGVTHIGEPVPAMVARVKQWIAEGKDVRIFTARVANAGTDSGRTWGETSGPISQWCLQHLGKMLPITCRKDMAMIELWDDRCKQVIENTGVTLEEQVGHLRRGLIAIAEGGCFGEGLSPDTKCPDHYTDPELFCDPCRANHSLKSV